METAKDLIGSVMRLKDWSHAQLAQRLGIKERTLKRIVSGEFELSETLHAHLETLTQILEPNFGTGDHQSSDSVHHDPAEYRLSMRRVPVLSWVHAGEAASYEELPKSWQESVPSSCFDPDAFGLAIEGDSMQPNYQQGDIVIVMPSTRPRNGCLVVAKFKTDGVVFRRFHLSPSGGGFRLTAYNTIYPPYEGEESDFHWIYPVHSTLKNEWKT